MSLVYTDSFFAFGKSNVSDAWDASSGAGNAVREANRLNLVRAGYGVFVPANAAKDSSGGFIVRNDPIYPERAQLFHSSDVTPGVALQYSAAIRRKMPITDKQIIVGFSLYIPPEYAPNTNNSTVAAFRVNATLQSDATWYQQGIVVASAKECFRVCNDLSLRWGTDAAQSSKKLTVGAVNYLEMRIDTGTVSVWIDDVFVMQKAVSLIPETIAFCFENNVNAGAGGSQLVGAAGRWGIGNLYYMINDGQAPTARLGPTTRIIGQRADTDVDVRFVRPGAVASNAAVAGQDLVDSPTYQLQSTNVGDFDTYTNNDAAIKASINTMGMVHAVVTKSLAANLEPDVHRIKPYIKAHGNNTEAADARPKDLVLISTSPTTKNIYAMAIDPTNGAIVICGAGEMMYRSGPNADLTTWTKISDTGAAFSFRSMYMRSDGSIFTGSAADAGGNGKSYFCAAGGTSLSVGTFVFAVGYAGEWVKSPDGATMRFNTKADQATTTSNSSYNANVTVFDGAAPQNSTWTITTYTFSGTSAGASAWQHWASKPDNSLSVGINSGINDGVYTNNSVASGGTLTYRAHGDTGGSYKCALWDGLAWLIAAESSGGTGGAPRIRRSLDAISWSAVTGIGNTNAGANQYLRAGAANRATQQSMFVGDAGSAVFSPNGIDWRQLPRLTANNLRAVVVTAAGDFIIGGDNGTIMRFQNQGTGGTDTALQPLAGYTMAFGASVINPATASAWTTSQAADADFGVRLTS